MKYIVKIILTLFVFSSQITFAQSPGGVSAGAELWYRADVGTNCNTNTCIVDDWEDQFGNTYDASQPSATLRPEFFSAMPEFNFNPAIKFSTGKRLAIESLNYIAQDRTHVYTWAVFKTTFNTGNSNANWALIDFDRSEFFNFYSQPDSGTMGWSFEANGIKDNDGTGVTNDGIVHLANAGYDMSLENDTTIRLDGDLETSTNRTALNLALGEAITRFGFIGDGSEANIFNGSSNNRGFNGEIAEVILYTNQQLTLTDKQKIESYLAIKYGITLKTSDGGVNGDYLNSNGNTIWDATSDAGIFHNEVFGIARDDNGGLHQKQSKSVLSSTGLTVYSGTGYAGTFPSSNSANTNNLANNQYLIFGHDNDDFNFAAVTPSPRGVDYCERQMNRIYKVVDSGSATSATLVFNPATFTSLVSGQNYNIAVGNMITVSNSVIFDLVTSAPLIETASGLFYSEIDFPNSQSSYFRIVEGRGERTGAGFEAGDVTPICYSLTEPPN